jgi:hypothetical protein
MEFADDNLIIPAQFLIRFPSKENVLAILRRPSAASVSVLLHAMMGVHSICELSVICICELRLVLERLLENG